MFRRCLIQNNFNISGDGKQHFSRSFGSRKQLYNTQTQNYTMLGEVLPLGMLEEKLFVGLKSGVSLAFWQKFCVGDWPWGQSRQWMHWMQWTGWMQCRSIPVILERQESVQTFWSNYGSKILKTTWWNVCVPFPFIPSFYPPRRQENLQDHRGCWPVAMSI